MRVFVLFQKIKSTTRINIMKFDEEQTFDYDIVLFHRKIITSSQKHSN